MMIMSRRTCCASHFLGAEWIFAWFFLDMRYEFSEQSERLELNGRVKYDLMTTGWFVDRKRNTMISIASWIHVRRAAAACLDSTP